MNRKRLFHQFLQWRAGHVSDTVFVLVLSIFIGFFAGIAAALMKSLVYSIEEKILSFYNSTDQIIIYFFFPLIGILLTVFFLKIILKDSVSHGVPQILYVISKLDGSMRRHKIYSSLVGGSLTAGFGGSVGLESPIISTGASMGSFIGQLLKLGYKHKILLIGCGAAGAMASIFTTPIAAVIFSFEVLLLDLTSASIIPLLLASVTGAVTTNMLTSEQYLVHFKVTQEFVAQDVPQYIILGIVAGFVSVYFHYMHFKIIQLFSKMKSFWKKALVGGSLLGAVLYFFPPLFSEGYDSIRQIINGQAQVMLNHTFVADSENYLVLVLFVVFLVIFKVIATTLTTEAGGVGGIFAPAAMMGGLSGFALSHGLNGFFPQLQLHESNFTLVGMASVLGGVLMAPLTAIFLIAEMSNGYELIVPLMLSTSVAYLIAKTFNKHSIFTHELIEQGNLVQFRENTVVKQIHIMSLLEKDVKTIALNSCLGDLVELIKDAKRNIFVVVGDNQLFIGVILLDTVRHDMFDRAKYSKPISDYLYSPLSDEKVYKNTEVQDILSKFNKTGNYNMIVVDSENRYVGVISRANLLKKYRENLLIELDDF
jgi:CIC family chloride channel protein